MGKIQVGSQSIWPMGATNSEAQAGLRDDIAITPANLLALGLISGGGDEYPSKTITAASQSVERLFRSEITITPSGGTFAMSPATDSLTSVRGAITLSSAASMTNGFLFGVQGKLILDGATLAVGSGHIAGLYGQISASGSTFTSGHIAAVIADIQAVPTSSNIDLFYGESATGNPINSFLKGFGKATYVFDLASNTHTQMSTTGTAGTTTAKGWLKVLVEGVTRYIPLSDSAT